MLRSDSLRIVTGDGIGLAFTGFVQRRGVNNQPPPINVAGGHRPSRHIFDLQNHASIAHLPTSETSIFQAGILFLEILGDKTKHKRALRLEREALGVERSFSSLKTMEPVVYNGYCGLRSPELERLL